MKQSGNHPPQAPEVKPLEYSYISSFHQKDITYLVYLVLYVHKDVMYVLYTF